MIVISTIRRSSLDRGDHLKMLIYEDTINIYDIVAASSPLSNVAILCGHHMEKSSNLNTNLIAIELWLIKFYYAFMHSIMFRIQELLKINARTREHFVKKYII